MTAALTSTQLINTLYPQSGIDNSSQTFRNNFNYIQTSLNDLNSYMDNLAGTTLNVNASTVTATQLLSALTLLKLGTGTNISTGQLGDIVITGQNPDGTAAAGSVGFFKNGSNPIFQDFVVVTSSDVNKMISQSFNQDLILSAGDDSDAYTNGTLVVEGGVGISKTLNVGGGLGINGNLTVQGNLINTSSNVTFNGVTLTGNLILKDKNNDASPAIILNTSSFLNFFVTSDTQSITSSTSSATNLTSGYQILPTGLIMMWGTTGLVSWQSTNTIPFPTLPGQSNPGFPNACLNLQMSYWNLNYNAGAAGTPPANNTPGTPGAFYWDVFPNIVSYNNSSFVFMSNASAVQNSSAGAFTWFAIGH